jgi:polyferredoxin
MTEAGTAAVELQTGGKEKTSRRWGLRIMRGSAQLAFLAFFIAIAWAATYPPSGLYDDNFFLRAEPLNAVLNHIFLAGLIFVLPALVLLLLTALSGRFFCAWICPLGTCFDFLPSAGRHGKRTLKTMRPRGITGRAREKQTVRLRPKYLFLAVLAILYVANIGLIWLFDPIVIANRAALFIFTGTIPVIFLLLLGLAMVYKPRYWCQEICPTGALFSAVSIPGKLLPERVSPLCLHKEEQDCTHCGKCSLACPFEIVDVADSCKTGRLALADCALCGDCVAACPCTGALSLKAFGRTIYASGRGGTCELVEEEEGGA